MGQPVGARGSDEDEDNKEVGLAYGFSVFAKACAAVSLFIMYFILDTKPGLYPSARFILVSYILIAGWSMVSYSFIYVMSMRVSSLLFRDLVNNSQFAIVSLVVSCLVTYLSVGMLSATLIVKQHRFLHDFITNNFIRTPRSFQRRQMATIMVATVILSCTTEPIYLASTLAHYITQSNGFFPGYGERSYLIVKYMVVAGSFAIILSVCTLTSFIGILTSFLITNVAKYTKILLSTQLNRISYRNTTDVHNPYLLSLLTNYEQRLIADFACYSITMDWPSLDHRAAGPPRPSGHQSDSKRSPTPTSDSGVAASSTSSSTSTRPKGRKVPKRAPIVDLSIGKLNQRNVRVAFGADALLFAYRNLIKNLNQLKGLIRSYERRFGYIHLIQIYITGLITAQWVVFGLLQIRSSETKDTRSNIELALPDFSKKYVFRAVLSVFTFVAANTLMFVRADRLPRQMSKMKSQLFRFNVELSRCAIESQQNRMTQNSFGAEDWPELEQVWLLYDQAIRMSHKARFRLGSNMVYDKNCLIQIFFSEVSAILIIIQLVDLYKFS